MQYKKIAMEHDKKIALVAHDNKKRDLQQALQVISWNMNLALQSQNSKADPWAAISKSVPRFLITRLIF
jgi:hypothetical protein